MSEGCGREWTESACIKTEPDYCGEGNNLCPECAEKSESKTLKDIELDKYSYPTKILKELAIKWVKEDRKYFGVNIAFDESEGLLYHIEQRWMKRLGITEEDLE